VKKALNAVAEALFDIGYGATYPLNDPKLKPAGEPMPEYIDMRPEVTCPLSGQELTEAVRNLAAARSYFRMLVMARGLDDELTQGAWGKLSAAVDALAVEKRRGR
jgi:hypothetical protein